MPILFGDINRVSLYMLNYNILLNILIHYHKIIFITYEPTCTRYYMQIIYIDRSELYYYRKESGFRSVFVVVAVAVVIISERAGNGGVFDTVALNKPQAQQCI